MNFIQPLLDLSLEKKLEINALEALCQLQEEQGGNISDEEFSLYENIFCRLMLCIRVSIVAEFEISVEFSAQPF